MLTAIVVMAVAIIARGCHRSENNGLSGASEQVQRVEGELFLRSPRDRTKFSRGKELAVQLHRIISEGRAAGEGKDQGHGYFRLVYSSGKADLVDIGDDGRLLVNRRTIQVQEQAFIALLEDVVRQEHSKRPNSPNTGPSNTSH